MGRKRCSSSVEFEQVSPGDFEIVDDSYSTVPTAEKSRHRYFDERLRLCSDVSDDTQNNSPVDKKRKSKKRKHRHASDIEDNSLNGRYSHRHKHKYKEKRSKRSKSHERENNHKRSSASDKKSHHRSKHDRRKEKKASSSINESHFERDIPLQSRWEEESQIRIKDEPLSPQTQNSQEDKRAPKVKTEKNVKTEKVSDNEEPKTSKGENDKVNFEVSGKLTEDSNTYNGIVIKYSQPEEARKPKRRWRWYIFKGDEELPFLPLHRQSAYLIGRERKVADIPTDHPSCSKQHAVLQYRLVSYERADGSTGRTVKPYIIDLGSANGTYVNNKRIQSKRYVELLEKDMVKFGYSSREYVLLHEGSKGDDDDGLQERDQSLSPVSLLRALH